MNCYLSYSIYHFHIMFLTWEFLELQSKQHTFIIHLESFGNGYKYVNTLLYVWTCYASACYIERKMFLTSSFTMNSVYDFRKACLKVITICWYKKKYDFRHTLTFNTCEIWSVLSSYGFNLEVKDAFDYSKRVIYSFY